MAGINFFLFNNFFYFHFENSKFFFMNEEKIQASISVS